MYGEKPTKSGGIPVVWKAFEVEIEEGRVWRGSMGREWKVGRVLKFTRGGHVYWFNFSLLSLFKAFKGELKTKKKFNFLQSLFWGLHSWSEVVVSGDSGSTTTKVPVGFHTKSGENLKHKFVSFW